MNPNNFFNNFFGNQQGNSWNPFNPNFVNNLGSTINNSMGFNPFGGQPQSQYPNNNPFGPNVNVNVNNQQGMPGGYQNPFAQYANSQGFPQGAQGPGGFSGQGQPNNTTKTGSDKDRDLMESENNPNSAHYYKRIGNEYFKRGLYQQAIENYTIAIEMNDAESVFYSNRARCYKNLKDFDKAYKDANVALELDDKNIKAHLLCGQILAEMGKLEPGSDKLNRALNRITKALTLCRSQNKLEFEKDLEKNIMRIRKVIWLKQEEVKKLKKAEALKNIKEIMRHNSSENDGINLKKYEELVDTIGDPLAHQLVDVPDQLCCKITMDLMENPVITEAGISYEKAALDDHFRRNGNFDPVTREMIDPKYVFPNKALKRAVEDYLKQNPWAFEYQYNESYHDIKF